MYKSPTAGYLYSPSDLSLYMRSPFASWMTRLALDKPEQVAGINRDKDALTDLLAKQGTIHENQFLKKLQDDFGQDQVAIIDESDKAAAAKKTLVAMKFGYKVIFQAYLQRDKFAGYADFLIRREGQSELGDYYYEAWDTKLSRSTKPYFVVQLCCYSWMLEAIQGRLPEEIVVVLGNQKEERFRIAAYYSYFQNLQQQFLIAQANFIADEGCMPDPALCKDYGVWGSYAKQLMETSDSLALIANIRKSQIKKLNNIGINTLSQLAHSENDLVKGVAPDSLYKLKAQASIQLQSRGLAKPGFKVLDDASGRGLSALPPKSAADVFFDIEGHPLIVGGLEYLWGVSYCDSQASQGKQYTFKDWWAHDQEQEKLAFEGFIDWVYKRWTDNPSMHIYHYASYEITAIRKLSNRYQTCLDEVAELLKNGVFIDLYKIVKNGLLIGEPKYSIKNVEHLYRGKRSTDVANGGESIVAYENWRDDGGVDNWAQQQNGYASWQSNPDGFDWTLWPELKAIRDYNIDDCDSTLELVIWLRTQQNANSISYKPPQKEPVDDDKTERQLANTAKRLALAQRQQTLINRLESDHQLKQDPHAQLLVSLLHFYDRERKPKIWSYYERLEKTDDELLDDDTVVHNIKVITTHAENGKLKCTASYNRDQPIRTDKIKTATVQGHAVTVSNIRFTEINPHQGEVGFIIDANNGHILAQSPLTLFGNEEHINTETLENRLCDITEQYFDGNELSGVLETLLDQAQPRFKNAADCLPVTRHLYPDNTDYLNAIATTVQSLDKTCLCIQGPPGSGKTHTAKHVIKALVAQYKRIGIMSNSHAAIMNLLLPLVKELPHCAIAKIGGHGTQKEFREIYPADIYPSLVYRPSISFTQAQPYDSFKIVAGTAFTFAKDEAYQQPLDYLFVDEASQVALANLVAVSGAAKNIILMGDQMQLEQPTQGSHPGQSGSSALEFMLKEHAVIPEDRGIFLERTFRMHPAVCQPLSEVVYEGKLEADTDNQNQAITIPQPTLINQAHGILPVTVQHAGNSQSSEEEVKIVQQLIDELKTGRFTDKQGHSRSITDQDILVIAPYNMQVNLLKEKLKGHLKIGTIDKFQGQEAPVVIISMSVSDVDDSPRGLDFVLDIHRLNVAISRAKALAIIVANDELERCSVNSLGQMEKVGLFCRLNNLLESPCF